MRKIGLVCLAVTFCLFHVHTLYGGGLERNVERPGNTYKKIILDKGDPALCEQACLDDSLCRAFTYYRPGLRGKKAMCQLKNAVPRKHSKAGCVSGVKESGNGGPGLVPAPVPPNPPPALKGKITRERNVERPGNTYKNIILAIGQPALCEQACLEDAVCRAFTYYRPGLRGKKAICQLKNAVPKKRMTAGCISGVKGSDAILPAPHPKPVPPGPAPAPGPVPKPVPPSPPPVSTGKMTSERNVERSGNTYKNIALDRGDASLCAQACLQDSLCRAFTYYRPGLKGKKAKCHLKNTVPKKHLKAGCVSGVKKTGGGGPGPVPKPVSPSPPPAPVGKMTRERNVERSGNTYKNIALDKGDASLCAQACLEDSLCRAFTYYRPGLKGKKAKCHLKNTVPKKHLKAGCVSGIKQ